MNQSFEVNNTTKDITHSGPVAQKLALHKGATLFADLSGGIVHFTPISFGSVKQAALGTTIVIDFINLGGDGAQRFTLNKVTGAPNGSVARALIKVLLFKRVGDCALLHFFACQRVSGDEFVTITSDDTSVLQPGATFLYLGNTATKLGGEAIAEIRAVDLTPGAEMVSLFMPDTNAFV